MKKNTLQKFSYAYFITTKYSNWWFCILSEHNHSSKALISITVKSYLLKISHLKRNASNILPSFKSSTPFLDNETRVCRIFCFNLKITNPKIEICS